MADATKAVKSLDNAADAATGAARRAPDFTQGNSMVPTSKKSGIGCFAAGTHLLTPDGSKPIEEFKPFDLVLSRDQADPDGPVVPKVVVSTVQNYLPLIAITVGDRVIRTTAEHPFWVVGRGWVDAHQIEKGDLLFGAALESIPVVAIDGPLPAETVYNLEIQDYHTYLVTGPLWGFAVWAHNNAGPLDPIPCGADVAPRVTYNPAPASLPTNTGGKMAGVLQVDGQRSLPLVSGVDGPSQAIRGQGLPGFNGNQLTHVEGHAAAYMRSNGITEAVLDINKVPCTAGSGGGCEGLLPKMLPEGATLRVRGPGGCDRTFKGLPD